MEMGMDETLRHGDGVLDSVMEFVATPAIAAELLDRLEYLHVNDSPPGDGNGTDVVTVTVSDGGCYYYDDTRLTGCPRQPAAAASAPLDNSPPGDTSDPSAASAAAATTAFYAAAAATADSSSSGRGVSVLRIEVQPYGELIGMVERHNESWQGGTPSGSSTCHWFIRST